jgi:hypothetical protein
MRANQPIAKFAESDFPANACHRLRCLKLIRQILRDFDLSNPTWSRRGSWKKDSDTGLREILIIQVCLVQIVMKRKPFEDALASYMEMEKIRA